MTYHSAIGKQFSFSASDHVTGIALWDVPARPQPTKLGTGEEFNVEISVICLTRGCNLMGKKLLVRDATGVIQGEGKTTEKAWNARYMKWQYRGRVKVKSPDKAGTYVWTAHFPRQNPHVEASVSMVISAGRGFPSPEEHPLFC